jgi:DNA repair protein RAD50
MGKQYYIRLFFCLIGLCSEFCLFKHFSMIRERRKKIIQDNIDLFKVESNINKLRNEIDKFQTELDAMNADAVRKKYESALANSRQFTNKIERINGRMQGLVEQKRNLKKKLNEPEYKGVDERQRMKMIEHETTSIVVTDLDKYYDSLDKALLSYHGMKINDINKIIRELWSLTYKGGGMYGAIKLLNWLSL